MGVKSDPGAATDTEDSPPGSLDGILTQGRGGERGLGVRSKELARYTEISGASKENPEGRWSSLSHQNVSGLKGTMGAGKGV